MEEVCAKLSLAKRVLSSKRLILIYSTRLNNEQVKELTQSSLNYHACYCDGYTYIACEVNNSSWSNFEYNPTIRIIKNLTQWNDIVDRIEREQ